MNWSLYMYLLAIVEIAIAVAVRRGEFSDSSFFCEEGRDISRLVFCRHLSLVLLRFFEVNRSIILLRGGGLSKVNKLEINPLFVLYLMPSMHWGVCNLPVPTYWHPYFPRMYRNVILI